MGCSPFANSLEVYSKIDMDGSVFFTKQIDLVYPMVYIYMLKIPILVYIYKDRDFL